MSSVASTMSFPLTFPGPFPLGAFLKLKSMSMLEKIVVKELDLRCSALAAIGEKDRNFVLITFELNLTTG